MKDPDLQSAPKTIATISPLVCGSGRKSDDLAAGKWQVNVDAAKGIQYGGDQRKQARKGVVGKSGKNKVGVFVENAACQKEKKQALNKSASRNQDDALENGTYGISDAQAFRLQLSVWCPSIFKPLSLMQAMSKLRTNFVKKLRSVCIINSNQGISESKKARQKFRKDRVFYRSPLAVGTVSAKKESVFIIDTAYHRKINDSSSSSACGRDHIQIKNIDRDENLVEISGKLQNADVTSRSSCQAGNQNAHADKVPEWFFEFLASHPILELEPYKCLESGPRDKCNGYEDSRVNRIQLAPLNGLPAEKYSNCKHLSLIEQSIHTTKLTTAEKPARFRNPAIKNQELRVKSELQSDLAHKLSLSESEQVDNGTCCSSTSSSSFFKEDRVISFEYGWKSKQMKSHATEPMFQKKKRDKSTVVKLGSVLQDTDANFKHYKTDFLKGFKDQNTIYDLSNKIKSKRKKCFPLNLQEKNYTVAKNHNEQTIITKKTSNKKYDKLQNAKKRVGKHWPFKKIRKGKQQQRFKSQDLCEVKSHIKHRIRHQNECMKIRKHISSWTFLNKSNSSSNGADEEIGPRCLPSISTNEKEKNVLRSRPRVSDTSNNGSFCTMVEGHWETALKTSNASSHKRSPTRISPSRVQSSSSPASKRNDSPNKTHGSIQGTKESPSKGPSPQKLMTTQGMARSYEGDFPLVKASHSPPASGKNNLSNPWQEVSSFVKKLKTQTKNAEATETKNETRYDQNKVFTFQSFPRPPPQGSLPDNLKPSLSPRCRTYMHRASFDNCEPVKGNTEALMASVSKWMTEVSQFRTKVELKAKTTCKFSPNLESGDYSSGSKCTKESTISKFCSMTIGETIPKQPLNKVMTSLNNTLGIKDISFNHPMADEEPNEGDGGDEEEEEDEETRAEREREALAKKEKEMEEALRRQREKEAREDPAKLCNTNCPPLPKMPCTGIETIHNLGINFSSREALEKQILASDFMAYNKRCENTCQNSNQGCCPAPPTCVSSGCKVKHACNCSPPKCIKGVMVNGCFPAASEVYDRVELMINNGFPKDRYCSDFMNRLANEISPPCLPPSPCKRRIYSPTKVYGKSVCCLSPMAKSCKLQQNNSSLDGAFIQTNNSFIDNVQPNEEEKPQPQKNNSSVYDKMEPDHRQACTPETQPSQKINLVQKNLKETSHERFSSIASSNFEVYDRSHIPKSVTIENREHQHSEKFIPKLSLETDVSNNQLAYDDEDSNDSVQTHNIDRCNNANHGKDVTNKGKDVMSKSENVPNNGKNVTNRGKDIISQGKNVTNNGKDITNNGKDVTNNGSDVANNGKTVAEKNCPPACPAPRPLCCAGPCPPPCGDVDPCPRPYCCPCPCPQPSFDPNPSPTKSCCCPKPCPKKTPCCTCPCAACPNFCSPKYMSKFLNEMMGECTTKCCPDPCPMIYVARKSSPFRDPLPGTASCSSNQCKKPVCCPTPKPNCCPSPCPKPCCPHYPCPSPKPSCCPSPCTTPCCPSPCPPQCCSPFCLPSCPPQCCSPSCLPSCAPPGPVCCPIPCKYPEGCPATFPEISPPCSNPLPAVLSSTNPLVREKLVCCSPPKCVCPTPCLTCFCHIAQHPTGCPCQTLNFTKVCNSESSSQLVEAVCKGPPPRPCPLPPECTNPCPYPDTCARISPCRSPCLPESCCPLPFAESSTCPNPFRLATFCSKPCNYSDTFSPQKSCPNPFRTSSDRLQICNPPICYSCPLNPDRSQPLNGCPNPFRSQTHCPNPYRSRPCPDPCRTASCYPALGVNMCNSSNRGQMTNSSSNSCRPASCCNSQCPNPFRTDSRCSSPCRPQRDCSGYCCPNPCAPLSCEPCVVANCCHEPCRVEGCPMSCYIDQERPQCLPPASCCPDPKRPSASPTTPHCAPSLKLKPSIFDDTSPTLKMQWENIDEKWCEIKEKVRSYMYEISLTKDNACRAKASCSELCSMASNVIETCSSVQCANICPENSPLCVNCSRCDDSCCDLTSASYHFEEPCFPCFSSYPCTLRNSCDLDTQQLVEKYTCGCPYHNCRNSCDDLCPPKQSSCYDPCDDACCYSSPKQCPYEAVSLCLSPSALERLCCSVPKCCLGITPSSEERRRKSIMERYSCDLPTRNFDCLGGLSYCSPDPCSFTCLSPPLPDPCCKPCYETSPCQLFSFDASSTENECKPEEPPSEEEEEEEETKKLCTITPGGKCDPDGKALDVSCDDSSKITRIARFVKDCLDKDVCPNGRPRPIVHIRYKSKNRNGCGEPQQLTDELKKQIRDVIRRTKELQRKNKAECKTSPNSRTVVRLKTGKNVPPECEYYKVEVEDSEKNRKKKKGCKYCQRGNGGKRKNGKNGNGGDCKICNRGCGSICNGGNGRNGFGCSGSICNRGCGSICNGGNGKNGYGGNGKNGYGGNGKNGYGGNGSICNCGNGRNGNGGIGRNGNGGNGRNGNGGNGRNGKGGNGSICNGGNGRNGKGGISRNGSGGISRNGSGGISRNGSGGNLINGNGGNGLNGNGGSGIFSNRGSGIFGNGGNGGSRQSSKISLNGGGPNGKNRRSSSYVGSGDLLGGNGKRNSRSSFNNSNNNNDHEHRCEKKKARNSVYSSGKHESLFSSNEQLWGPLQYIQDNLEYLPVDYAPSYSAVCDTAESQSLKKSALFLTSTAVQQCHHQQQKIPHNASFTVNAFQKNAARSHRQNDQNVRRVASTPCNSHLNKLNQFWSSSWQIGSPSSSLNEVKKKYELETNTTAPRWLENSNVSEFRFKRGVAKNFEEGEQSPPFEVPSVPLLTNEEGKTTNTYDFCVHEYSSDGLEKSNVKCDELCVESGISEPNKLRIHSFYEGANSNFENTTIKENSVKSNPSSDCFENGKTLTMYCSEVCGTHKMLPIHKKDRSFMEKHITDSLAAGDTGIQDMRSSKRRFLRKLQSNILSEAEEICLPSMRAAPMKKDDFVRFSKAVHRQSDLQNADEELSFRVGTAEIVNASASRVVLEGVFVERTHQTSTSHVCSSDLPKIEDSREILPFRLVLHRTNRLETPKVKGFYTRKFNCSGKFGNWSARSR